MIEKKACLIEIKTVYERGRANDRNYLLHKNGSSVWVHGESVLVKGRDEKDFIVKMIYDINEQKLLEGSLFKSNEDLKKSNEDLLAANKDLDTFVYTASHDLNAPLNNLEALFSALVGELDQKTTEKEGVREIIGMMEQSLQSFTKTINDLATTGRAQAERQEKPPSVNFKDSMEEVKDSLKEMIQKDQAEIVEDFQEAPEVSLPTT